MKSAFSALLVALIFWLGGKYFPEYLTIEDTKTLIIATISYFFSMFAIGIVIALIIIACPFLLNWLDKMNVKSTVYKITYKDDNGVEQTFESYSYRETYLKVKILKLENIEIEKKQRLIGKISNFINNIVDKVTDNWWSIVVLIAFVVVIFLTITPVVLLLLNKYLSGFAIHGGWKTYLVLTIILSIFASGSTSSSNYGKNKQ